MQVQLDKLYLAPVSCLLGIQLAFWMLQRHSIWNQLMNVKLMLSVTKLAMPICQISLLDLVAPEGFLMVSSIHCGALPQTCHSDFLQFITILRRIKIFTAQWKCLAGHMSLNVKVLKGRLSAYAEIAYKILFMRSMLEMLLIQTLSFVLASRTNQSSPISFVYTKAVYRSSICRACIINAASWE